MVRALAVRNGGKMELKIDFKFKMGDLVASNLKKEMGLVIKRWSKIVKLNNDTYILTKSYTIAPEKPPRFKSEEDELVFID